MTLPQDVLGVDVAKGWIDVFHLAAGSASGARRRIAATPGAGGVARVGAGARGRVGGWQGMAG